MEIIGAAALIAVALVVAALVYTRGHSGGARPTVAKRDAPDRSNREAELTEREAALVRREESRNHSIEWRRSQHHGRHHQRG